MVGREAPHNVSLKSREGARRNLIGILAFTLAVLYKHGGKYSIYRAQFGIIQKYKIVGALKCEKCRIGL